MRTLLLALLAVAALVGCSTASEQDVARDESGDVTETDELGVFAIQNGDCLMMPDDSADSVETVTAVPCSEPHSGEVYALVQSSGDDGEYPGDVAINTEAAEECERTFDETTGLVYATDPDWGITWLTPSEDSWNLGDDREIVCIAGPLEGGTTTDILPKA
jgi:hypothetical protein